MKQHKYTKYRPKECQHPTFEGVDYCWGLAMAVEGRARNVFILFRCPKCEFYKKKFEGKRG